MSHKTLSLTFALILLAQTVKQIAEPYVYRLDKLLTDYLRAIQTPK